MQDLAQRRALAALGYRFEPWPYWGISFMAVNFTNPAIGPIFRQLYVRQAMQHLIDQPLYLKRIFAGLGYPTYGPVPLQPRTPFISPQEMDNPYPYSVASARSLLRSHGWAVAVNGLSHCVRAGTGPGRCGPGIREGATLAFTLQYVSGTLAVTQEVEALRSAFLAAGIQLTATSAPFGTVLGNATPCRLPTSHVGCSWDMAYWGTGSWTYEPDYYPTGGEIFGSGAAANSGGYANPTNEANIIATHTEPGLAPLHRYENYLARNLPVLWLPNTYYQLSEVSTRLHGTQPQTSAAYLAPEYWSLGG